VRRLSALGQYRRWFLVQTQNRHAEIATAEVRVPLWGSFHRSRGLWSESFDRCMSAVQGTEISA
jgi:hypothetical protein